MSFFYEDVNPDWRCKVCGTSLTLEQYERRYCEDCKDVATQGKIPAQGRKPTEGQINAEVYRACYPGWEQDFLLRLNEWRDKRDRLR